MRNAVHEFIKSCRAFQQINARNRKPHGLLQSIELTEPEWEVITMDCVLALPKTKNGYSIISNVVDKLTKMIRMISVKPNITAQK